VRRAPSAATSETRGTTRPATRPGIGSDPTRARLPALDAARGVAILAMIAYHFCVDLAYNGWLVADFGEDIRWLAFRVPILGSFLFIAGLSLALAEARGESPSRFWRRVGIVAGSAALVSLGSWIMFPQSFIWFGVLHAIASMSVLARWLLPAGRWLAVAGIAIVAVGVAVKLPLFDQPPLQWIGMMTFKPRTEDYVPLVPWFGVFLVGAACGSWLARHAAVLAAIPVPRPLGWIAFLGHHSLAVYLIHQPVLLGSMRLVRSVL
jgi:uncharacterized membrane protein